MRCPCGAGEYADCCEPLHDGARHEQTALELMRSRYCAYAVGNLNYVFRTWHPRSRPAQLEADDLEWVGLDIIDTQQGTADDSTGVVEFVAHYRYNGEPSFLRERSRFARRRERWVYVDAIDA
ncbi:YchJ family protein [Cumulibacter soli]|uniref:YchJ family protein n=1 Tax=Cumulibacter soli TaxID=2546344 RepID=UPI00106878F3|nr:YchJ family metal-binding protein [Cumulibacter soli]